MEKIKLKLNELKQQESQRRNEARVFDRTLTKRNDDEIKIMFERNNRIVKRMKNTKRFSTLWNDRVF